MSEYNTREDNKVIWIIETKQAVEINGTHEEGISNSYTYSHEEAKSKLKSLLEDFLAIYKDLKSIEFHRIEYNILEGFASVTWRDLEREEFCIRTKSWKIFCAHPFDD